MWGKLRSALFIDFENVGSRLTPTALSAMTAWLEDGRFDDAGRSRRLVAKRVYWNSAAEKHRDVFEAAGFEVVLCEKFSAMKNGADIRMALDVLDSCWKAPEIKEYILFTTDSDFVPVLQRLAERSKLSAILVNEAAMAAHTAFSIYADLVVPVRALVNEGLTYARPPQRGWLPILQLPFLQGWMPAAGAPQSAAQPAAQPARPAQPGGPGQDKAKPQSPHELLAQAERAVVRVASRTPKQFVPRRTIERQLQEIKGFKKKGQNCYLGKQHYLGLMQEVARMDSRIMVKPGLSNSASVMYLPES
jgi:hypothetical protein